MQVELGSIRWRGAWERVEYTPTDCFPLPCKFLHELKISSDGNAAQWKSRLVACSNMSKEPLEQVTIGEKCASQSEVKTTRKKPTCYFLSKPSIQRLGVSFE